MRLFWCVVIGLLETPVLTHIVWEAGSPLWAVLPFLVLVLILSFLSQQN